MLSLHMPLCEVVIFYNSIFYIFCHLGLELLKQFSASNDGRDLLTSEKLEDFIKSPRSSRVHLSMLPQKRTSIWSYMYTTQPAESHA